ncbi:GNAT family N-acetyltransferase [Nocardioides koreensis]
MTITWGPLTESDLPALRDLARACLDADGGLPILTSDGLLRARLLAGETLAARDETGALVAAAGAAVRDGAATTSGLVHPAHRGQGLGRRLMEWAAAAAGPAFLTAATETCEPTAERLYARFGLAEGFAELVMRHPLGEVPVVPAPDGVELVAVADASHRDLFAAYVGSFSDRPGFPDPTEDEWLEELAEDDDWRRDLSLVALDADGQPVGFVNVLDTWVDQVGAVPAWRGRGLGAHLVSRSLQALAAEGATEAWLTVNVDNPAADLYTRLGFETFGKRARFSSPAR